MSDTATVPCFRCGKQTPRGSRRKNARVFCSDSCKCHTYREEHKKPLREYTCRFCGKTWTNEAKRSGARWLYCSMECCLKARYATNRKLPQSGVVPVGSTFIRSHDGAKCVVMIDERGLPFVEALREPEAR